MRSVAGLLFVLAALLVAAGVARPLDASEEQRAGQQASADTIGCLDTLRASDTLSAVVKIAVRPQNRKTQLPPDFEEFFAQEFKERFKVAGNLPLSVMRGMGTCDSTAHNCTKGWLWLSSTAYAIARANGTLSRIGVVDESLTPELAKAVKAVLDEMTSERRVPAIREDSLPLEVALRVESNPDTVSRSRQLFRVRLPQYDLTFTMAKARQKPAVQYPRNAERAGVGDSVTASFTILADGAVDLRSFDLSSGHYRDFVQAVIASLEKARYEPARIGTCPVASSATQSFVFKVPR